MGTVDRTHHRRRSTGSFDITLNLSSITSLPRPRIISYHWITIWIIGIEGSMQRITMKERMEVGRQLLRGGGSRNGHLPGEMGNGGGL